jgi:prevent-host-death family protein
MREEISTLELRQRLGEILDRTFLRNDEFVVSRKGRPLAAIVPVARLNQLKQAASRYLVEMADRDRRKVGQREADRLANEAKHRTRPRPGKRG